MAKAAKKSAAKPATKATAKTKTERAKTEKKAAPKKTAPKKKIQSEELSQADDSEIETEAIEAPIATKISRKEKAAKAASDKLLSEEAKKWSELQSKHGSEKTVPYQMTGTYEANTPIQHKVLGWGYVLSVQNDRLEVLFETGTKMLISNYKAS